MVDDESSRVEATRGAVGSRSGSSKGEDVVTPEEEEQVGLK